MLILCGSLSASAGRIVTDTIQSRVLEAQVVCNVYLPDLFSSCYAMSAWLSFDGNNDYPAGSRPNLLQEAVRTHFALRFVEQADNATLDRSGS